jgi:dipeptidyl aminopeptidase/acylaminoacyl peptidase
VKLAAVICVGVLVIPTSASGLSEQRGEPSGRYAGQPARGHVLLIHGGGWYLVGPHMLAQMLGNEASLNEQGYATLNIEYRAGHRALVDVVAAYDRWRSELGPRARVCAFGSSAGGHLALMLAKRRPDLACVVSNAGPTNLRTLSPKFRRLARRFFSRHGGLDAWSPALDPPRQPLLLPHATADPVVPFDQAVELGKAAPSARVVPLRPGDAGWVHASVSPGGLHYLARVERAFLARALTP